MNARIRPTRILIVFLVLFCFSFLVEGCSIVQKSGSSDKDSKSSSSVKDTEKNKDSTKKDSTVRDSEDKAENETQTNKGTYEWNNGDRYEGDLKSGLPDGQGTFSRKSSKTGQWEVVYDGQWLSGKMNGTGTMTNTDGDIYTGNWKDNMPSGQGTLKCKGDGGWQEYSGNWTPKPANSQGKVYSEWDGKPPWDYYPTIPGK